MWKRNPFCMSCGDILSLHRGRLCRFEQGGWIRVAEKLPPMETVVLAMRGTQTFAAKTVRNNFLMHKNDSPFEWVSPYRDKDCNPCNGCVSGVTHWRNLRRGEKKIESKSILT